MYEICHRIANEKDHTTFGKLVDDLLNLIDQKEQRFPPDPPEPGN